MLIASLSAVAAVGCAPEAPGNTWVPAGCFDSANQGSPDLRYSGTPNARGNLTVAFNLTTFDLSSDGTCNGVALGEPYTFSLVRADDAGAAEVRCATLNLNDGVEQINSEYAAFPADAWVCNPPAPEAA